MITKVVIEQFGPFRERVELPLADQGFVLIKGRNLVSAAADANGVGKSSIAHAIAWGLFGEDLAGRKADAVACRFTQGTCSVRLDLEDSLGKWSILRTRRPARLMAEGIPGIAENEDMALIQQKIVQRLGIGLRTFKNAVVFGQGAFDRFAQADQAEAMKMLDEIQGIDFRGALQRATDWRKDLREKQDTAVRDKDTVASQKAALDHSITVMLRVRNNFEVEKNNQVAHAKARETKAAQRVESILNEIASRKQSGLALAAIKPEIVKADEIRKELDRRLEVLAAATADAEKAQARLDDLKARLEELTRQDACPTCRQPVKARKAKIRELFSLDLSERTASSRASEERVAAFKAKHGECSEEYTAQLGVCGRLTPAGQDTTKYVAGLEIISSKSAMDTLTANEKDAARELTSAESEVKTAETQTWSGAADLTKAQAESVSLGLKVETLIGRIPKIEIAIKMADYAVEAFGDRGIRSMLVDGVADYVNERAAAHLEILAAGEATQKMSATTDLKKGGAKEKISFKREWSWGGNGPDDGSGGQDRRMDLATFAAVQDLSEHRSARPFPVKIWDEPGDALDARGQELFLQWVAQQARKRGTGLLITHSEGIAAAADPDHVWTVVLDKDGARVEIDA